MQQTEKYKVINKLDTLFCKYADTKETKYLHEMKLLIDTQIYLDAEEKNSNKT